VSQTTMLPASATSPGLCEWCGASLSGRQTVACSAAHKTKRHRWLHGIGHPPVRPPWANSPLLTREPTDRRGPRNRSGLQCSAPRIVRVLCGRLNLPEEAARAIVREALSDRQRARLDAR
jgi:hypothetical protein